MNVAAKMTVEEFCALPEPERGIRELIDGEVVVTSPNTEHQLVVVELIAAIHAWCRVAPGRGRVIGNIDTLAGPATVLEPDLQYYADPDWLANRRERPKPLGQLVVEVRSPSTWSRDVGVKRAAYERKGVPELWLIDPVARSVLVYRRSAASGETFDIGLDLVEGDSLGSPLMPGFSMPVSALFA